MLVLTPSVVDTRTHTHTPNEQEKIEPLHTENLVWQETLSQPRTQLKTGARGVEDRGLKAANPDVGAIRNASDALKHQMRLSLRHRRGES